MVGTLRFAHPDRDNNQQKGMGRYMTTETKIDTGTDELLCVSATASPLLR
jgi:hypothetical protein